MHRLAALSVLLLAFAAAPVAAQTNPTVKVKVRAVLYDRDLNMKPVPHVELTFKNLDQPSAAPVVAQTSLDGTMETDLPPGHYQVTSSKPIEFQGKTYQWDFPAQLTKPENVLELSNDNAKVADLTGGRSAQVDSLAQHFQELKDSVVTVRTQDGLGTGFLVDSAGLIITNQHVIDGHTYLAVQFDNQHKVVAEVLAEDKVKDVAVLRVNLTNAPKTVVAPIAQGSGALLEGERVFTIGNPLGEDKVLTTGVVSKVSEDTIISDISISSGNSGGALFNSSGAAVGITSYRKGNSASAGLTGIVPIAQATPLLVTAKTKAASSAAPAAGLLPVPPMVKYPPDGLRTLGAKPWQKDIYYFKLGDFDVEVVTPVTHYNARKMRADEEQKVAEKRAKKQGGTVPPEKVLATDEKYDAVVSIVVLPRMKVDFWKSMATQGNGVSMSFRHVFLGMTLFCDANEVVPVLPERAGVTMIRRDGSIFLDENNFQGKYSYLPDVFSQGCKEMRVRLLTSKPIDPPLEKALTPETVSAVVADFEPYRKALASPPAK